ncbi:hypothetical protein CJ030_MR7G011451 [Morella rubra]|uniref:Uncharacterized protein n=1 Tax=Morella rubra TaxID=262757 RepID=A0A6A1V7H1_9ROSI|nr:hypothetical protein CJ030_MR7G011451 [Morella rubra]
MGSSGSTLAGAVVAGVGLAAAAYVTIADLMSDDSGTTTSKKTMKAPGRDVTIYRDDFERDTAGYFRDLRKK